MLGSRFCTPEQVIGALSEKTITHETPYAPLKFDPAVEEAYRRRGGRIARWFRKIFELLLCDVVAGAEQIAAQLEQRRHFPHSMWQSAGFPLDATVQILKVLEEEIGLSSFHLIPLDPFVLLMAVGVDDDPWLYLFSEIKDVFGVEYSDAELDRMIEENWSVGRLVSDILAKSGKLASNTSGSDTARAEG